eukprot:TRINITY_DN6812_c1_g1_i1.p1 TRINITY_DN6812_c1_g1~~TRINITY_DN6812_c1_g1_i1.p1  ORF type:complete len:142 (-),score=2.70 TRINITY_DN6812_c1_g1_i1:105-530(-)
MLVRDTCKTHADGPWRKIQRQAIHRHGRHHLPEVQYNPSISLAVLHGQTKNELLGRTTQGESAGCNRETGAGKAGWGVGCNRISLLASRIATPRFCQDPARVSSVNIVPVCQSWLLVKYPGQSRQPDSDIHNGVPCRQPAV